MDATAAAKLDHPRDQTREHRDSPKMHIPTHSRVSWMALAHEFVEFFHTHGWGSAERDAQ